MAEVRYQRRSDVLFTTVDGEVLALDVALGQCFGLNGVASEVWDLLAQPRSLSELSAALLDRFEVSEDQCRNEVGALLDRFSADGLIRPQPGS